MPPWISPSIIRISKSADPGLIPVINRRRTRPRHLNDYRFPHDGYINALIGCLCPQGIRPSHLLVGSGKESGMVMVGKFIHCYMERGGGEAGHMMVHCPYKAVCIAVQVAPVIVAVLLHTCQEPCHRLHKGIVIHDRIPLFTVEPFPWRTIMLCQHYGIGICLPDSPSEFSPEIMVIFRTVSQIGCHIQTPSVCIIWGWHPFGCNPHYILKEFLGLFIIQFRQGIMPPPSVIAPVIGPCIFIIKLEIIVIRAFPAYMCAFFIAFGIFINPFLVHPFIKGTAVVKYAV